MRPRPPLRSLQVILEHDTCGGRASRRPPLPPHTQVSCFQVSLAGCGECWLATSHACRPTTVSPSLASSTRGGRDGGGLVFERSRPNHVYVCVKVQAAYVMRPPPAPLCVRMNQVRNAHHAVARRHPPPPLRLYPDTFVSHSCPRVFGARFLECSKLRAHCPRGACFYAFCAFDRVRPLPQAPVVASTFHGQRTARGQAERHSHARLFASQPCVAQLSLSMPYIWQGIRMTLDRPCAGHSGWTRSASSGLCSPSLGGCRPRRCIFALIDSVRRETAKGQVSFAAALEAFLREQSSPVALLWKMQTFSTRRRHHSYGFRRRRLRRRLRRHPAPNKRPLRSPMSTHEPHVCCGNWRRCVLFLFFG